MHGDKPRSYRFGSCQLSLIFGSITDAATEVVVSSDDYMLSMGGGVSAAISRAGGEAIMFDAAKKVPAEIGDVVVTTAGDLPALYVFHAITIGRDGPAEDPAEVIRSIVRKCFSLLDSLGLTTIAFPAIGAGVAGYDYSDVAVVMSEEIAEIFGGCQRPLSASLYLYDRFGRMGFVDYVEFFEEFHAKAASFSEERLEQPVEPDEAGKQQDDAVGRAARTDARLSRRQLHVRELSHLSRRRDDLETTLARLAGGLDSGQRPGLTTAERERIKEELSAIQQRRLDLLEAVHEPRAHGLEAFISYAHEDEDVLRPLKNHLKALEQQDLVSVWTDRSIRPGSDWQSEIDSQLETADLVLLLVSADFLASDYCIGVEMERALERHEAGECLVIPIVVRPVSWDHLELSALQALPRDAKAIKDWSSLDAACVDVVDGIRTAIEDFFPRDGT